MTSPDLTPYVDLTVHDKTPQDLVDDALIEAQAEWPEWNPAAADTEVVLIESVSVPISMLLFAVNRLPNALAVILFRLWGVERDEGAAPTADVRFDLLETTSPTEIPAGTRVVLELSGGREPVVFTTLDVAVAAVGEAFVTAPAVGDRLTDEANDVAAGTLLTALSFLENVTSTSLATDVAGGRSVEDDQVWMTRAASRLQRLNETLVTPEHFELRALDEVDVERAFAIDTTPGQIDVAVYGNDELVTALRKDEIEAAMEAQTLAQLVVNVIDPTITAVPVTVTVTAEAGATAATVQADVQAALTAYLNPMTWDWSSTVRRNDLIALIDAVPGVAFVNAGEPAAPAADVALPGSAPLADAGALTVTVV